MLGGKKKYKCRFEVKVEKIEGLPDKVKGNPFRVEYARGKDHTGISRTLTMTSKNMAVNYSFKFDSNLMFEEKKGARKFSEKSLTFQVVAEKSKDVKKDTNIGKAEFDLSLVAVPGEFEAKQRIECHGKDKSDTKCILVVSFKTEVIKIDGKKLVKKDPSKSSSSSSKSTSKTGDDPYDDLPDFGDDPAAAAAGGNRTVQVDGQEYDLQTDMDLSEGGMDSDGDAKTENDYLSDSDEKADPFEQDAELTDDEKKLAKKLEDEENDAAKKKADEAKKKADAEAAAKADADKKAAADADKKLNDDKKSKEEEKKRKEEEEKKRKEEEKKKKEDEKRAKEEEEKRKKEEEKKRKEDEKRAKEEEEKRKKQEKADLKAGIVPSISASSVAATSATSTNSSAPNSARDVKDSKTSKSDSTSSAASTATAAASVAGLSALEAKLKQVQEDRDKAQDEVKRLTEALDDEKSRAATLKKEVKSNETTIKELEAKLKREETKNDDLEGDVRRLNDRGAIGGASAAAAASTSSSDASEITWLEGQLRKVRGENEELHGEIDDLKHRLHIQEEIVEQHDAGYAAKCIADLETENAKLRKKLDDADLLKGDLMQELKHRQSERTIRVDQHNKDVAAGIATTEERTGYKRHSRQSSMDSASGSAATSPRTNGSSTKDAKKDTKDAKKDVKKVEEKPAPAPPKETKKPAISMDDDPAPSTASRSKRAGGSILPIPEESDNAFASADNSAALAALETKLKHVESIEAWLYNAKMDYDEDGWATAAQQMSDYIVRAQRALHRKEQHSESAYSLLVHMLSAIYGQSQRHAEDLDVLVGLFQWCVTLLQQLQRESDTLEDAPAGSYMTWAVDIDNCGCILTFDAMIDAQETMSNGKFHVGKSFDDISADATPGEAFLKLLDQLTSYVYTLIFSCLQTVIDEQRLTDLFFGQTAQLAAAMNPNSSRANGSSSGNRKVAPPRPMASFTAQLDVFLSSARRHRLPKVIEAQMLGQFFYWCSCTIVNALVRSGEHCSAMVGMSLKVAVSHVEQWISQNSPRKLAGWVEDQFAATREAANVLTIDKHIFQSIDALEGIFTTLNIAQIHKLLTQFQPDDFAPDAVPRTTLDVLRNTINKTNAKVTYLDGTVLVGLTN